MEKNQDNRHTSKCCGVMSPHRKKHQTHFRLFIFLFFLLRVTVEWRALLLPGFPPTFEQARVLRKRATNFCSMQLIIWFFWSQKVFLMAGRSPLKCDNSHWRSIDWFGTIHTEWNARCLTCVHSTSEIVCNRGKQDYT